MTADVEVLDRDGTVIAVVPGGATEVPRTPPPPGVEDLFRFATALDTALEDGLDELLGKT